MVGRGMAGRRGCHVAQHQIGGAAERGADLSYRFGVAEVALEERCAGQRIGLGQIDADDCRAGLSRDLTPAARRAAEIDNPRASRQQMKTRVELLQLEGGARPVALAARLGDVRIVQLPRQPIGRGRLAAPGASHPDRQLPPAAAAGCLRHQSI